MGTHSPFRINDPNQYEFQVILQFNASVSLIKYPLFGISNNFEHAFIILFYFLFFHISLKIENQTN